MKDIRETWTIEATAGTVGVDENTFQYAIIERSAAADKAAAIAYVGAERWNHRSFVSVFARPTFAFAENVGREDSGEVGSVGIPDFSSRAEAEDFAAEEEKLAAEEEL